MLNVYRDAPAFYDGTELSATALNTLRTNAAVLDLISQRAAPIQPIHRKIQGWEGGYVGSWIFAGGFQFRTGLTTARFRISATNPGGGITVYMRVTFDGVIKHDAILSTGDNQTFDFPISTYGYADYQVVPVEIMVYGLDRDNSPTAGTYYVWDAFTFPLSSVMVGAYGGVPTFGTINQTRLNQLSDAQDWVATRLALVPYLPQMNYIHWAGGYQTGQALPFYYFTATRNNGNTRLRLNYVVTTANPSTSARLHSWFNSTNYDQGPYTVETDDDSYDLDLTTFLPDNSDAIFDFGEIVTTGQADSIRDKFHTRWNLIGVRVEKSSYTMSTLPSEFTLAGDYAYSTLQTSLQQICTAVTTAKNRIDNVPALFDRARMFRNRFGINAGQNKFWEPRMIAGHHRVGNVLWIRGQGLQLSWGSFKRIIPAGESVPDSETWGYEFLYNENLTEGDKVETKYVHLDRYEGLPPGSLYFITGTDIQFASEYLR